MQLSLAFWVLMLIWLVLGFWSAWPLSGPNARNSAGNLLLFLILVTLGWQAFGPPIK